MSQILIKVQILSFGKFTWELRHNRICSQRYVAYREIAEIKLLSQQERKVRALKGETQK